MRVGKKTETERQQVSESVRKEDVKIETEGEAKSRIEKGADRTKTAPYEPMERSRRQ